MDIINKLEALRDELEDEIVGGEERGVKKEALVVKINELIGLLIDYDINYEIE